MPARVGSSFLRRWLAVFLWLAFVFLASTVPLPRGPKVDLPLGPDKIGHVLTYAVLGALAARAVWRPRKWAVLVGASLVAAVAYGALLEGWQHLIGRDAQMGDVAADAIGAALGTLAVVAAHRSRPRNRSEMEHSGHDEGGRAQAD